MKAVGCGLAGGIDLSSIEFQFPPQAFDIFERETNASDTANTEAIHEQNGEIECLESIQLFIDGLNSSSLWHFRLFDLKHAESWLALCEGTDFSTSFSPITAETPLIPTIYDHQDHRIDIEYVHTPVLLEIEGKEAEESETSC